MPYTIVLTPPAEQAMKLIEASQTLYKDCQPSYLLTDDGTSSPHITIVQFDCISAEQAEAVWLRMLAKMQEQNFVPFSPSFVGVAFVEGTGPYENTTWVELSVKRGSDDSPIMQVLYTALEVLQYFGLEPLNAAGNNYRPHLTLARIVMPKQLKAWSKILYNSSGRFNLELGLSDEKWQYAKTLQIF